MTGREGREIKKQEAFLVASLVLLLLGISACEVSDEAERIEKELEEELMASPTLTSRPPSTSTPIIYVVQRGDTLVGIAALYQTTAEAICLFNELPDCSLIYPGQELLIPATTVTPVHPQETPLLTPVPPMPTITAEPAWLCCSDCAEVGMPINLWSWNGHERVKIVDELPHGTQVLVLESERGDDGRLYYHVVREEHEGWVSKPFICWSAPE